jgi:hypothetical protein
LSKKKQTRRKGGECCVNLHIQKRKRRRQNDMFYGFVDSSMMKHEKETKVAGFVACFTGGVCFVVARVFFVVLAIKASCFR